MFRFLHPLKQRSALMYARLLGGLLTVFVAGLFIADSSSRGDPATSAVTILDKKIMDDAKAHSEIMKNLGYLSDEIGPRLTGSANLKRANEWTAEKMRSYGLENVHLEPWEVPVGWERGTVSARICEPEGGRKLTMASMAWTPGTKGKIVGDVVIMKARTKEDLAAYKGKLKNAIVLTQPPATIAPVTDVNPFGGKRFNEGGGKRGGPDTKDATQKKDDATKKDEPKKDDVAKKDAPAKKDGDKKADEPMPPRRGDRQFGGAFMAFRRELSDFLRAEGAAATLQDSSKPHGLLNMTGGWRGNDRGAAQDPLPSMFVVHEDYALLYRLASRPAPAKTCVELEVTNKFVPGPITVYNTVGDIRGSEKPDEFVVVGAHLDSWDLGQGTTDNGTGSSVVLETARLLAKCGVKPKRTIRFVLFTGEEQGLYGSKEYVKKHKDELPKISLCIVHDTGTGKVTGLGTEDRPVVKSILEGELGAVLKELGVEVNLRRLMGTDHNSFNPVGVPGIACQQDPAEYRFTHHSQSDTFDKAREPDLIQGAQVMALTALHVANMPELLPREKPATPTTPRGEKK